MKKLIITLTTVKANTTLVVTTVYNEKSLFANVNVYLDTCCRTRTGEDFATSISKATKFAQAVGPKRKK
jgi:hypothetical protein